MRKLQVYVDKYGPIAGPKLYHLLQSQAAHAGVAARLRRKLREVRAGERSRATRKPAEVLPLFPDADEVDAPPNEPGDSR